LRDILIEDEIVKQKAINTGLLVQTPEGKFVWKDEL